MPRAALLSLHARVEGTTPTTWEGAVPHAVVGAPLQHLPRRRVGCAGVHPRSAAGIRIDAARRRVAGGPSGEGAWRRAHDGERGGAGARRAPNRLRYATLTGRVANPMGRREAADPLDGAAARHRRWRGAARARPPLPARVRPRDAEAFAAWAGIPSQAGAATFGALGASLIPVLTPIGDGWILASDEPLFRRRWCRRTRATPSEWRRVLPLPAARRTGAAGRERGPPGPPLDVARVARRAARRRHHRRHVAPRAGGGLIETWRRLSRPERQAVEAEAASLPLPGRVRGVAVHWVV